MVPIRGFGPLESQLAGGLDIRLGEVVLGFPSVFWTGSTPDSIYISAQRGEYPVFFDLSQFNGQPVLAGHVGAQFARNRAALAEPASERVLFAGEATIED